MSPRTAVPPTDDAAVDAGGTRARFLHELDLAEVADLVDDIGRQATACREAIRQAGEVAQAALARRDRAAVARALDEEQAEQQRLPTLEAQLREATARLLELRKPLIGQVAAEAEAANGARVVDQAAAVRRIEALAEQLDSAIDELGRVRAAWPAEEHDFDARFAAVDPTESTARPTWRRPPPPDLIPVAMRVQQSGTRIGRLSVEG
jgi:hypothetical protein